MSMRCLTSCLPFWHTQLHWRMQLLWSKPLLGWLIARSMLSYSSVCEDSVLPYLQVTAVCVDSMWSHCDTVQSVQTVCKVSQEVKLFLFELSKSGCQSGDCTWYVQLRVLSRKIRPTFANSCKIAHRSWCMQQQILSACSELDNRLIIESNILRIMN